jgi:hypothetical protein
VQVQSATPCSKKSKQTKTTKKLTPQTTLSLSLSRCHESASSALQDANARRLRQVATCAPHGADDRMQGVLIGNGGEEGGHKQKPRKRFHEQFRMQRGHLGNQPAVIHTTNQHSGIRRCGVREGNVGRCAGHSFVEFLPFRFPLRRLQRRERIGPLSGGGNSEGRGGCWHTWAG